MRRRQEKMSRLKDTSSSPSNILSNLPEYFSAGQWSDMVSEAAN
jgi:hypothetical protein